MRELKFRAWDEEAESWGYFVFGQPFSNLQNDAYSMRCVEGANFCQYTGLKDKNGKDIYEGDIVSDGTHNGKVFYNIDSAQYQVDFSPIEDCPQEIGRNTMWAEVIGNIYENNLNENKHETSH